MRCRIFCALTHTSLSLSAPLHVHDILIRALDQCSQHNNSTDMPLSLVLFPFRSFHSLVLALCLFIFGSGSGSLSVVPSFSISRRVTLSAQNLSRTSVYIVFNICVSVTESDIWRTQHNSSLSSRECASVFISRKCPCEKFLCAHKHHHHQQQPPPPPATMIILAATKVPYNYIRFG